MRCFTQADNCTEKHSSPLPDSTLSFLFLWHPSCPQMPIQFCLLLTMKWEISGLWTRQVQCQKSDSCWCLCKEKAGVKKIFVNSNLTKILSLYFIGRMHLMQNRTRSSRYLRDIMSYVRTQANSRNNQKTSASTTGHSLNKPAAPLLIQSFILQTLKQRVLRRLLKNNSAVAHWIKKADKPS